MPSVLLVRFLAVALLLALDETAVEAVGINRRHCHQMPGFVIPASRCCRLWNEGATCPNEAYHYRAKMHKFTLQALENGEGNNKSVDDYVLNVHGGKYRFEDPSSVGTAVGRSFAESLYSSSSSSSAEKEEEAAAAAYAVWPKWAKRMVSSTSLPCSVQSLEVPASGEIISVKIQNEYRTWEPYYARIIRLTEDPDVEEQLAPPFQLVGKVHGKLAPQGGSSNLCDENDPYSDFKYVSVRFMGDNTCILAEEDTWFLAVGTEEEKWYYRLVLRQV